MDIAVPLIINAVLMEVHSTDLQELDGFLYQGYLDGLHDIGWHGDARQVRLGFTAAAACKYLEILIGVNARHYLTDPDQSRQLEKILGHPMSEIIEQTGGLFRHVMRLADESRQLMDDLGYR